MSSPGRGSRERSAFSVPAATLRKRRPNDQGRRSRAGARLTGAGMSAEGGLKPEERTTAPQANVWQRCGCPARNAHPDGPCPVTAGLESAVAFICMPCLTGCGLSIRSASEYTYSDCWRQQCTGFHPVVVVANDQSGRAGDSDREDGYRKLADAFIKGSLPLEEYERRLGRVGDATWRAEIQSCLADLT